VNTKQQRFVEAYLTTAAGNATKAAEAAGYSVKTAGQIGSRLLKHVQVRQAIDARSDILAKRADAKADRLIAEVQEVAYTKTDVTERGKMKALELLGRYHKLWQPQHDKGPGGITVNIGFINQPTDDLPVLTIDTHALVKSTEPK
jgi:hypothetical protein